jgi:hypothetical protein
LSCSVLAFALHSNCLFTGTMRGVRGECWCGIALEMTSSMRNQLPNLRSMSTGHELVSGLIPRPEFFGFPMVDSTLRPFTQRCTKNSCPTDARVIFRGSHKLKRRPWRQPPSTYQRPNNATNDSHTHLYNNASQTNAQVDSNTARCHWCCCGW